MTDNEEKKNLNEDEKNEIQEKEETVEKNENKQEEVVEKVEVTEKVEEVKKDKEKDKNFFVKNQRIIIPIITGIVGLTIGFYWGDASAVARIKKNIAESFNTTDTDNSKTENKKTDTKKKKEISKVAIGETGAMNNWEIKILEAKEADSVPGAGKYSDPVSTGEKFIILKLEMKNVANTAKQYSGNDFSLYQEKDGKLYDVVDSAFEAAQELNSQETIYNKNKNFTGVYDDINPGTTKNTYIVFEVPKDESIDNLFFVDKRNANSDKPVYMSLS